MATENSKSGFKFGIGDTVISRDRSITRIYGKLGKVVFRTYAPLTGLPIYEIDIEGEPFGWTVHEHSLEATDDEPEDDNHASPAHYNSLRVEPIKVIVGNEMETCKGNIVKYACRAGNKMYPGKTAHESEVADLEKVIRYANYRIEHLKEHYID